MGIAESGRFEYRQRMQLNKIHCANSSCVAFGRLTFGVCVHLAGHAVKDRKLATANRSRISIRATKIGQGRGVVDPEENLFSSSLII